MILGLDEEIFWNADLSFVKSVIENKGAYDTWLSKVREEMRESE